MSTYPFPQKWAGSSQARAQDRHLGLTLCRELSVEHCFTGLRTLPEPRPFNVQKAWEAAAGKTQNLKSNLLKL